MKYIIALLVLSVCCFVNAQNRDLTAHQRMLLNDLSSTNPHNAPLKFPNNGKSLLHKKQNKVLKVNGVNSSFYLPQQAIVNDTTRYTYSYDSEGKMLTRFLENYSDGEWVNKSWITTSYDSKGNEHSVLTQIWGEWRWNDDYLEVFTRDTNDNCLMYNSYIRFNGTWGTNLRYTYTYDSAGNNITFLKEFYNGDHWQNDYRDSSIFDGNGRCITLVRDFWDHTVWGSSLRYTSIYDTNGNLFTYITEQFWPDAWVNFEIANYTYDARGNLIVIDYGGWHTGGWSYTTRDTCTYDSQGNLLSDILQYGSTASWRNIYRSVYRYDDMGNATNGQCDVWDDAWKPTLGAMDMSYNRKNSHLTFYGNRVDLQYICLTDVNETGTQKTAYTLSQNYPNPFNPATTIIYTLQEPCKVELTVYNQLGQNVATLFSGEAQTGGHSVQWNASNVPSGVYFYQLKTGKYTITKKLLLLK